MSEATEAMTIPTSPFTVDSFIAYVGQPFTVCRDAIAPTIIELIEAEPVTLNPRDSRARGKSGNVRTDPFALLFRGAPDVVLPQGLYQFEHQHMGSFIMSIVPVGPGEGGMLYESIFN
ncbi:MAG: hypothetical protein JSS75_10450 [Bacteroidetes bacterium]|nr:hypothetical protein [Bacteroidota bacterium]